MKCPYCEYDDEYINRPAGAGELDEQDYGKFYILSNSIVMVRHDIPQHETKHLQGCPKCGIVFIDLN